MPTAASLTEVTQKVRVPVIASGGIRSGVDAAKALALGAALVGTAHQVLDPAVHGSEAVEKRLVLMIEELRNTMFLVGANSVEKLTNVPVVVTGRLADWLTARGFQPQFFARRGS